MSRLAEADRERIRGGSFFGLSLLIVAAIMSHGHACGCVKAEMLAINDDGTSSGYSLAQTTCSLPYLSQHCERVQITNMVDLSDTIPGWALRKC